MKLYVVDSWQPKIRSVIRIALIKEDYDIKSTLIFHLNTFTIYATDIAYFPTDRQRMCLPAMHSWVIYDNLDIRLFSRGLINGD